MRLPAGRPTLFSIIHRPRFSAALISLIIAANAALVCLIWVGHEGLERTASLPQALTAAGQLSALFGTYIAIVGLLLVARVPLLERLLGDRAARYHRVLGISAVGLISLHVIFTVAGYAMTDGVSFYSEFTTEVITYPYMLAALVGFGLLLLVGASSMRVVRSRISHETWTGMHLHAYLAIVLAFGHQLAVGTDLSSDLRGAGAKLAGTPYFGRMTTTLAPPACARSMASLQSASACLF
jgi:DMSO/TMAO reductase YedYZ heme-binding membrane subunit